MGWNNFLRWRDLFTPICDAAFEVARPFHTSLCSGEFWQASSQWQQKGLKLLQSVLHNVCINHWLISFLHQLTSEGILCLIIKSSCPLILFTKLNCIIFLYIPTLMWFWGMVYFQLAGHTEQNEAVGERCLVTTRFFELILRQFPDKFIVYMDQQSAQNK